MIDRSLMWTCSRNVGRMTSWTAISMSDVRTRYPFNNATALPNFEWKFVSRMRITIEQRRWSRIRLTVQLPILEYLDHRHLIRKTIDDQWLIVHRHESVIWKINLTNENEFPNMHTGMVQIDIVVFSTLVPELAFLCIKIPIPKYHENSSNHKYLYVLRCSIQVHRQ